MDMKDLDEFKEEIAKRCAGCDALARQGGAFLTQHKQLLDKIDENTKLTQKIYIFLNGELDHEGLVTRVIGLEEWVKVQKKKRGLVSSWISTTMGIIIGGIIVAIFTGILQFHVGP